MHVKNKFISWDFLCSFSITVYLFFAMPEQVDLRFCVDLYSLAINIILMCIFYFLAMLALLVAASDETFINYLRNQGLRVSVFLTYKYTLIMLFLTLIFTIFHYAWGDYYLKAVPNVTTQSKYFFLTFLALFIYCVFTSFESSLDSINYLKLRVMFMAARNQKEKQELDMEEVEKTGASLLNRLRKLF